MTTLDIEQNDKYLREVLYQVWRDGRDGIDRYDSVVKAEDCIRDTYAQRLANEQKRKALALANGFVHEFEHQGFVHISEWDAWLDDTQPAQVEQKEST